MAFETGNTKNDNFSLPPLHPSHSTSSLISKRRSGISKKIAQKIAQNSLTPVDSVQLHQSCSSNDISCISDPSDHPLDGIDHLSIDRYTGTPDLSRTHSDNVLIKDSISNTDYEKSETPSSSRQTHSLDDQIEDNETVQSIRSITLPRISNEEARKRMQTNYLLVKSKKSTINLYDRDELERCFPDGKVTLFVGTWNMAGQDVASKVLTDWLLPENMHMTADIYAIGIQEAVFNPNGFKAWESKLQRCLWSCKQVLFHSVSLGVQHLAIFVRRELIWFLSNGPDPNGRIRDYHRIVDALHWKSFGWRGPNVLENVDVAFWAGDLNFRLEEKRNIVEAMVKAACTTSTIGYNLLLERDQLRRELALGGLFHKFKEHPIHFPPTYKYDLGTSIFDTSPKNRVPAYTDRILFRTKPTDPSDADILEPVIYDSVPCIKNSDHKPVYGVFRIKIKAGNDHMPTPKFDTAIFQAGLTRDRDDAMTGAMMRSKVCVLM